ncbi:MAG: (Na+)-NQR maturation NqrM [Acidobacteriota bacterium]
MSILLVVIPLVALMIAGMAVGVIISNRSLRGSCGGVAVVGPDGDPLTCGNCDCKVPEADDASSHAVS